MTARTVRLAIDIGGTFTDLEFVDAATGRSATFKAPTTPGDPSVGLMDAILGAAARYGFALDDVSLLLHGTTIATNAVLTRSLPVGALVTTGGFEDVLEIGRHARRDIYSLRPERRSVLVPRRRRFGVAERIGSTGAVLRPLEPPEIDRAVDLVVASGAEVAAICLLNAFVDPRHEIALRERFRARAPSIDVSCSHEISPEIREFERSSTTVLNALLMPVVRRYIEKLATRREAARFAAPLYLIQSNGGATTPADAAVGPARLLLSGPSGGVLAAERLAALLGEPNVVAVDMGGTSYDVSLIHEGRRATVSNGEVDGCPVRLPMVEMRTIGAGGGSIVWLDASGRLQVGPKSAGAEPGPVCYGRGGVEPTVTDANVILGRLDPATFLGGQIDLDVPLARQAFGRIAGVLGLSVEALAEGVLEIVVAKFAHAIKLSLFERGLDPADFALMSFGGAGGLHAIETAEELGMRRVVFPKDPSTFSAHGILQSDIVHDLARAKILPLAPGAAETVRVIAAELRREGERLLVEDGLPEADRAYALSADLRYRNQAFELPVPVEAPEVTDAVIADLALRFHDLHRSRFSFDDRAETVELVTLRLAAIGRLGEVPQAPIPETARAEPPRSRPVRLRGATRDVPVHGQSSLAPGATVEGPAIVEQDYTTLLLPEGWSLTATPFGDLLAHRTGAIADAAKHTRAKPSLGERVARPLAEATSPPTGRRPEMATGPVLLEIVSHALVAAAEDMSVTVWRTSRSTTVRELLDYSTAVFDADGHNLAQAARTPVHLNSMELCLDEVVRTLPLDRWQEGDVVVTNDPYCGGQHLPDFIAFKPVFAEGRRVAIACALTHHVDVGGGAAGGYNARAVEIFQEGIRLPPVRLVRAGELQTDLLATLLANVREPETFRGDILSQVAALEVGGRGIRALVDRYGAERLAEVGRDILDGSERAMRAAIAALPDGTYRAEDFVDGDGLEEGRKRIAVRLTVAGDRMEVDFAGTSPQALGPINATMATTRSAVYYAAIAGSGMSGTANAGCYRPIAVTAPEGTLVSARFPAPVSMRMLTGHRIVTAVMRALAAAAPDRIPASYYAVTFNHAVDILYADGRRQVYFDSEIGGWGASPEADGPSGLSAGFHNNQNSPVEMTEAIFPVLFLRYGFRPGSGGAGRRRGGLGLVREWRFEAEAGRLNAAFDAFDSLPYGLAGGLPGQGGTLTVTRDGAETHLPSKVLGHPLRHGDIVRLETPGGGGFGDPADREPAEMEADLADGLVQPLAATPKSDHASR